MAEKNKHPNRILHVSIWMLVFFPLIGSAQTRDSLTSLLSMDIPVPDRIDQATNYLTSEAENQNDSLCYLYYDFSNWLYRKDTPKAIEYGEKALSQARKQTVTDTSFWTNAMISLAFFYERSRQFKPALDYYERVIQLKDTSFLTRNAYSKVAYVSMLTHDYHKAIEYYHLAISLLKKSGGQLIGLRNAYSNMSRCYLYLDSKETTIKAEKYALLADSVSTAINSIDRVKYIIKLNLAGIYNRHEYLDVEKGLKYYDEALTLAKKMQDSVRISAALYGKGSLLNTTDLEKAEAYHLEGLNYTVKTDTLNYFRHHGDLGTINGYRKEFMKSLDHQYKSLKSLTGLDFEDTSSNHIKSLSDFEHRTSLLFAIRKLAETHLKYYEETRDNLLLERSIRYFEIADELIDQLKINSNDFQSRLFWRESSTNIYGKAIKACHLSDNREKAFFFMEKNKALLLMEDIALQEYKRSISLAPELLEEELRLKKEIILSEEVLESDRSWTNIELDSVKKRIADTKINLNKLQDSIGQDASILEQKLQITSLKNVQSTLEENQVAMAYHISIDDGFGLYSNNTNGYLFFITHNEVHFFEISDLRTLKEEVTFLINSCKYPFQDQNEIDTYNKVSKRVYERLFPSEEIRKMIHGKEVIVIPDSYLSLLPFEALVTSDSPNSYLIYDCAIRYLYSFSFLKNFAKDTAADPVAVGFSPEQFSDPNLSVLQNSSGEIEALNNYYETSSFFGKNATKSDFLKNLDQYSIIHLATHADAQDSISPWIAFADEKLLLDELYLTQNNASLVFLSGCNTTLGKQAIGEGVISLARGFFYSGSQSVISSLWSIDDQSTSEIVADFYKNLNSGQTKADALRNAKLSYLDSHELSQTSPHYWASLILLGENDTLQSDSPNWLFVIGGIMVILLIIFLVRRFR